MEVLTLFLCLIGMAYGDVTRISTNITELEINSTATDITTITTTNTSCVTATPTEMGEPNFKPCKNKPGSKTPKCKPAHDPIMIPSRVSVRCRYATSKYDYQPEVVLYKFFIKPHGIAYPNWCATMQQLTRYNCFPHNATEPIIPVDINNNKGDSSSSMLEPRGKRARKHSILTRCDAEGKDMLWERGFEGSLEVYDSNKNTSDCMTRLVVESLPGSVIDWMRHEGCYLQPGGNPALEP